MREVLKGQLRGTTDECHNRGGHFLTLKAAAVTLWKTYCLPTDMVHQVLMAVESTTRENKGGCMSPKKKRWWVEKARESNSSAFSPLPVGYPRPADLPRSERIARCRNRSRKCGKAREGSGRIFLYQVQLPGKPLVRIGAHMLRYTITTVEVDMMALQAEAYRKVHEACASNLIPPAIANDGKGKTRPNGIACSGDSGISSPKKLMLHPAPTRLISSDTPAAYIHT